MKNKIEKKGAYELYESTEGHELLKLSNNDIYALVETNQGHILVNTDEEHEKQKTIQKGNYYLIDMDNDRSFRDTPHLFLEKDSKYQELILPRGLPNGTDIRKKIIFSNQKITREKIELHLTNKVNEIVKNTHLQEMEKKEFDRQAKKMGINGHSSMKKDELAKKIKKET